VDLVEVNVVGAEPPEAVLALADYVVSRETSIVGSVSHRHPDLGGEEQIVSPPRDRLPEYLLGLTVRVDIRGVEEVDPGVQAHVNLSPGPGHIRRADFAEAALPAEGHRA
jgi:hypothetical protein